MAGQSSVNLRVRERGDACMIPVLSRRAWLASRRLKPTTGNQKLTILDTNSAWTFRLNYKYYAYGERAQVRERDPVLSRRPPSLL